MEVIYGNIPDQFMIGTVAKAPDELNRKPRESVPPPTASHKVPIQLTSNLVAIVAGPLGVWTKILPDLAPTGTVAVICV